MGRILTTSRLIILVYQPVISSPTILTLKKELEHLHELLGCHSTTVVYVTRLLCHLII